MQGKLDPRGKAEHVVRLLRALPSHTKFPPSMVPEVAAKSLVRGPDGYFVDSESHWDAADGTQRIVVDLSRSSQYRTLSLLPNLVVDERGDSILEESRQAQHDVGDPRERW